MAFRKNNLKLRLVWNSLLYTVLTHNVPGKAICLPILWFDILYLNNLHLSKHACKVVLDLFCIFPENTHEQQLNPAKILYQWPSRNNLDFVYGGSQFSTGVIILRVRHVKNDPCDIFSTHETRFSMARGSFLYDEKLPLGRFSTGVVIRRYTGGPFMPGHKTMIPCERPCHKGYTRNIKALPRKVLKLWPMLQFLFTQPMPTLGLWH